MLQARPEIADLTMPYGDEHRPIHYAVMQRSAEMVRLLMWHGANARQGIDPHRDATAAWTIAKERGYDEIVAIIEAEERRRGETTEDAPEVEAIGDEAARAAVASGNIEWLRARHAEGTLVNPIRWDDGGLLTAAMRHNKPDMLRLLVDYGFDPDERVSIGERRLGGVLAMARLICFIELGHLRRYHGMAVEPVRLDVGTNGRLHLGAHAREILLQFAGVFYPDDFTGGRDPKDGRAATRVRKCG